MLRRVTVGECDVPGCGATFRVDHERDGMPYPLDAIAGWMHDDDTGADFCPAHATSEEAPALRLVDAG